MSGYQKFFKARREVDSQKKHGRSLRAPRKPLKFKTGATVTLFVCFLAGSGVWYLTGGEEQVSKLYSRFEVSIFGSARAEEGAKSAEEKTKSEEKTSLDTTPEVQAAKEPKHSWTDEEVALFTKLEERKTQLDAREASLNKLEEELQSQKTELEKRLAALEQVRGQIASKLENKVKSDGEKVTALVSVYSNMKPAQAAKIMEGLNEDLAIEVLNKMKNKSAAEILNMMDSEKAKHLSEKFAGFRDREPASNFAN